MEAIEVTGIRLLSEEEKKIANELLNEYYIRIQRLFRNMTSLRVRIKEHEKEGKRKKYSIHVEAVAPTRIFEASNFDWDFARALHKVLNSVMNEIEHKVHSSEQHPKMKLKGAAWKFMRVK